MRSIERKRGNTLVSQHSTIEAVKRC